MAAQDIIIRPIITEKSMAGIGAKKYTFEVAKDATKIDIAHAVEGAGQTVHIAGEPLACGTHAATMPLLTDSVDIDAVVVGIEFFLADGDALFRGEDVDGVLLVFL